MIHVVPTCSSRSISVGPRSFKGLSQGDVWPWVWLSVRGHAQCEQGRREGGRAVSVAKGE
jgi:hypothetical protein